MLNAIRQKLFAESLRLSLRPPDSYRDGACIRGVMRFSTKIGPLNGSVQNL